MTRRAVAAVVTGWRARNESVQPQDITGALSAIMARLDQLEARLNP
jgi:hypothetical protein